MGFNPTVYVVDDDEGVRSFIQVACATPTRRVECYSTADEFLSAYEDSGEHSRCLILDVHLPGMSGLELHCRLVEADMLIPVILLTGFGDVSSAVESIQRGAVDFLEKPVSRQALLESVERGLFLDSERRTGRKLQQSLERKIQSLSKREREVFELLRECKTNKQIAAVMDIGFQTAAKHRSNVFRKLNVGNEFEFMQLVNYAENLFGVENLANGNGKRLAGKRLA